MFIRAAMSKAGGKMFGTVQSAVIRHPGDWGTVACLPPARACGIGAASHLQLQR